MQVEREAGNAMIQQQQQTNQTLNGLKSNSDLQRGGIMSNEDEDIYILVIESVPE